MRDYSRFLAEHRALSRRHFVKVGAGGVAATLLGSRAVADEPPADAPPAKPAKHQQLGDGVKNVESLITPQEKFYDVSRGEPLPHSLPEEKLREVGLTRETWKLDVISDHEHPVPMRNPLSKEKDTSLDFAGLMQLAEKGAVRFAKAMTCLNLGCPLGFGVWEGVPLRDVIWLTQPREALRRVFYYGYHNDQPEQMFRSSLPIGRVFEDYDGLPPVILSYKLNGQWLNPQRGGPVRVVVPEHYGFKSVKWLTHVVLTNLPHANDTYAEQGNDVDSPLKTFAATIDVPGEIKAGEPIPITGYAQVGIGGLSKVQAWLHAEGEPLPAGDRYFLKAAPWVDMEILGPPDNWGEGIPEGKIPAETLGFEPTTGRPLAWPMRLTLAHWAGVLQGVPAGKYTLRCRAIDQQGHAQPDPRPFRKSGHAAIEQVTLVVS